MYLNFKNIALESIGLILLGFGVEKLKIASQSEQYLALLENDLGKLEALTSGSIGWFFAEKSLWRFGAFVIGFVIIGLIKLWKGNKMGLLDSFIAFLIAFSLIHLGFYGAKFPNSIINLIGRIITEDFKIIYIINGLLWSIIGIGIIWFTLKKHYTQQGL